MSKNSKKKSTKACVGHKSQKSTISTPAKSADQSLLDETVPRVEEIKFETANGTSTSACAAVLPSSAASRLEAILAELEGGCFADAAKEAGDQVDPVGFIRKKMAALGFQAGIQLSGSGAMRDARKILDGFPGDDEYDITFEPLDGESDEDTDDLDDSDFDEGDEIIDFEAALDEKLFTANISDEFLLGLDPLRALSGKLKDQKAKLQEKLNQPASQSVSLDPSNLSLSYPLIDPLKLQVIQSAETELTTVHDLFESNTISASQKLPLLKRKYMELMQQDIRHRLEALRIRDYLDTLHLERQVVERELEKAIHLKTTLEQLCEQLQAENSKIKGEKAGLNSKIYGELELQALAEDEEQTIRNTPINKKNFNNKTGKKGKQVTNNSSSKEALKPASFSMPRQFPTSLPEALKPISFELPDANKMISEASGDFKVLQQRVILLVEIFNQREVHFMSILKAKDTEIALLQSHFYQQMIQMQKTSASNRDLSMKLNSLSSSEADLRAQLGIYVDKFKQVEDTLAKSNDLFATFRHEMEQMTAKLGRIEKENQMLQTKCSTLSRNIIEMADERSKQIKEMDVIRAQKTKLESLCRSLQAERNAALKTNSLESATDVIHGGKVEQIAS